MKAEGRYASDGIFDFEMNTMAIWRRGLGLRQGVISLFAFLLFAAQLPGAETPGPFGPDAVLIVSESGKQEIRLSYSGVFPLKVLSAIEDGLRVEIVTEIVIRRKSGFFLFRDSVFASFAISRGIRYDLIESRYSITDEKSGGILYFTSRNRFLSALAAEIAYPIDAARKFERGAGYYAEARVMLRVGKLYPPFSFLPIISHTSSWVRSPEYLP